MSLKIMLDLTSSIDKTLSSQIYSFNLLENLVNDMMDLAKTENQSLALSNDHFSLCGTIFETFQILNSAAYQQGVELVGQIDHSSNLNLIQEVVGD
jgi:signal transduction histidine kinase